MTSWNLHPVLSHPRGTPVGTHSTAGWGQGSHGTHGDRVGRGLPPGLSRPWTSGGAPRWEVAQQAPRGRRGALTSLLHYSRNKHFQEEHPLSVPIVTPRCHLPHSPLHSSQHLPLSLRLSLTAARSPVCLGQVPGNECPLPRLPQQQQGSGVRGYRPSAMRSAGKTCVPPAASQRSPAGRRSRVTCLIVFLPSPIDLLHSQPGQLPSTLLTLTAEAVPCPPGTLHGAPKQDWVKEGQRQPSEGVGVARSRRARGLLSGHPC